ncbi:MULTISPECIES: GNAT family N-acetyltransferase [Pseudomonas]|uniref:GNAT family N-acetyltransferase n=1 Tax=Pseudomonas quercus TaxID=2722792 RepID=A0ABX0YN92_9PSED|nr:MULTISPECIES: GNAT family N-acetyltransferase [Pseudomonas]MBF7144887.1 GNAT family N-acetyltransferase [Pseudomonas sp. LY10J]NJP03438.1 GNAT family N-acetyltransferase [Pseudomonas quercus]
MSGINRNPSIGNQAWWNNPATESSTSSHATGANTSVTAQVDHASTAVQQTASNLPHRSGQHTAPGSYQTAQLARSQLTQARLFEHSHLNTSASSSTPQVRNLAISSISDADVRKEASAMYHAVESMGDPDELEDHLEMLKWMHEDEEKAPTLVSLPESNLKISSGGTAVGLMTLSVDLKNKEGTTKKDKQPTLWVDQIVTMPNTKGHGKALIGSALDSSEQNGYGGIIRTVAKSSPEFYERLGFKEINGGVLELNPHNSPEWSKVNGGWQFRS